MYLVTSACFAAFDATWANTSREAGALQIALAYTVRSTSSQLWSELNFNIFFYSDSAHSSTRSSLRQAVRRRPRLSTFIIDSSASQQAAKNQDGTAASSQQWPTQWAAWQRRNERPACTYNNHIKISLYKWSIQSYNVMKNIITARGVSPPSTFRRSFTSPPRMNFENALSALRVRPSTTRPSKNCTNVASAPTLGGQGRACGDANAAPMYLKWLNIIKY